MFRSAGKIYRISWLRFHRIYQFSEMPRHSGAIAEIIGTESTERPKCDQREQFGRTVARAPDGRARASDHLTSCEMRPISAANGAGGWAAMPDEGRGTSPKEWQADRA